MYENMTAQRLLERMLLRVPNDLDKREGSIIYDSLAPASLELAEAYIMARVILKETFATTASREFLILRAEEYNISPYEASAAEVEAQFNEAVSIGTRFNQGNLNFAVTELIDNTKHTYKMLCETAGEAGNDCIGAVVPIDTISGLTSANIISIITPGEDEEETETFRARYIAALKSKAYGGNGDDYREKVLALQGISGVKVYRCWNGGGTVKLVILSSEYNLPSAERIAEVQKAIDPLDAPGQGYGIAPIGHTVTVVAASVAPINVTATVTPASGYSVEDLNATITESISAYLQTLRKNWCNQKDTEFIIVRTSYVQNAILSVPNVLDAIEVTVNGKSDRLVLKTDEVPTMGNVELKEGSI